MWFYFELEYQKGLDNTVADVLSQVTTQLDPHTVRSILIRVPLGAVHQAKVHYHLFCPCHYLHVVYKFHPLWNQDTDWSFVEKTSVKQGLNAKCVQIFRCPFCT